MRVHKQVVKDGAKALAAHQDNDWDALGKDDRKSYKSDARAVLKSLSDETIKYINGAAEIVELAL